MRSPHITQAAGHRGASGFTLVEAVVVIAVVIAAAALGAPRLAEAGSVEPGVRTLQSLRELRRAVTVYAVQHADVPPGHPEGHPANAPTEAALRTQLTGWTDAAGRSVSHPHAAYPFGPYLRAMPVNTVSDRSTVRFVAPGRTIDAPTGAAGWAYQPTTLTVVIDTIGRDGRGVRYFDY